MKATAAALAPLLGALGRVAVVALHGGPPGLARQVARTILRAACGTEDDPFRVRVLDPCERGELEEALASSALGGGRAAVWVPEASEKLAPLIEGALGGDGAPLLVLGFGERFERSGLGATITASGRGCVVSCALDAAGAERLLASSLEPFAVTCDGASGRTLAAWAASSGQSLDVVAAAAALLAGAGGRIDAAVLSALGAAGDGGAVGAAVRAGLSGDASALDRAVTQALQDGQSGVGMIRQALAQVQFARAGASRGGGPAGLERAAAMLWAAELLAKRSGPPQEVVAAAAVRALARPRGERA